MLSGWRRLAAARGALAGIEFAIVVPVLLAMLAGVVDLSRAVITMRRLTVAAEDVALVASTMAVQASALNTLSSQQAWQATTAPFALFPNWRSATGGFSVTLSAVEFTPTPAGCTTACSGYVPRTRWSVSNRAGAVALRPCGALSVVANGSPDRMTTLPAGAVGQTSLLIGDVSTVFVPLFTGLFVGPVTLLRSAYIPPRVSNGIRLTGAGPGQTQMQAEVVTCP